MSPERSPERASELIRGPKWRTRTTPSRRHRAAMLTFAIVVGVGTALLAGSIWALSLAGAPPWLVSLPWWLPTIGAVVWTLGRPAPAEVTDDDDDSWFGHSLRWVLVGELAPRPAIARVVAAIVFGAPVAWALLVIGLLTLLGIV
jgi:hypothetical protein